VTKQRLDEALVARGLFPSRARARDAVLRETVSVNGRVSAKPAQTVQPTDEIAISDPAQGYVSRAALKLLHALHEFQIDVKDRVCLDIGASTGGFTQVLLERGAKHVTAIDVGHGQMAPAIADDPRVTLIEGMNARDLSSVPGGLSLIVCDVSFISLKIALPPALSLAPVGCLLVALIKPQFEVGRENLGKRGIVREASLAEQVNAEIQAFLINSGWSVAGVTQSPVRGGDGNAERLIFAIKPISGK
jgi:23S rRNA (cytidine1920-2'-O)/16S rRNA (cytidine1409-2'-O)-methyltransferase